MGFSAGHGVRFTSLIQALVSDSPDSDVRRKLAQFNMIVIPLCDPKKHADVADVFVERFEDLDHATGENLLFFAPINDQGEWDFRIVNREYYQTLKQFERQFGRSLNSSVRTADPGHAACVLAETLGVPQDALPCLAVVRNMSDRDVIWYRTCGNHLFDQLVKLARLSKSDPSGVSWRNPPKSMDPNLCHGWGNETIDESFERKLRDLLNVIIAAGGGPDQSDQTSALARLNARIRTVQTSLKLTDSLDAEMSEIPEEVNKAANHMLNLLSMLCTNQTSNSLANEFCLPEEILEPESVLKIKSALYTVEALELGSAAGTVHFDYTLPTIGIASAFEHEINMSLFHWIRKGLGIELPEYFNRYQPGIDNAQVIPKKLHSPQPINFNQRKGTEDGSTLQIPGLGQTRLAAEEYSKDRGCPDDWSQEDWNATLSNWRTIQKFRNDAAHTAGIPERSKFEELKTAVRTLAQMGTFEKMSRLKAALRPPR